jgi:hypothetical protein
MSEISGNVTRRRNPVPRIEPLPPFVAIAMLSTYTHCVEALSLISMPAYQAEWTDEFMKKLPEMWHDPFLTQLTHNFYFGKM